MVKSLLLNGADKTSGWDNGQAVVAGGGSSYVKTTQGLDWAAGTGRMNLDTTFDLQVNGQTDVPGTSRATSATSSRPAGITATRRSETDQRLRDLRVARGGHDADGDPLLVAQPVLRLAGLPIADVAQADLNLSIWELDGSDSFTTLMASSESLYNTAEHLSFTLTRSGFYGLRVDYPLNTFDNTTGDVWGNAANLQPYAVSWQAVPEPGMLALSAVGSCSAAIFLRRRRR